MLRTVEGKRLKSNGFKSLAAVKSQFKKAGLTPATAGTTEKEDGMTEDKNTPDLIEALQIMLSIWEYPGLPRKHPFILNGGDPRELCQNAIAKAKAQIKPLTTKDIAAHYKCTEACIRVRARRLGVGRKVGNNWLYDPEDLERLRPQRAGRPRKEK